MSFRTVYSSPVRYHAPTGSRVQDVRSAKVDPKGNLTIVSIGQKDLYAEIQSHALSVDIHEIVRRFTAGDQDALSRMQGFYADFADMPSTYQEVLNAVIAGEQSFNSLPVEIKQRFGNNFASWLIAMESPDFPSMMGFTSPDMGETASPSAPMSAASPVPPPAQTSVAASSSSE